MNSPFAVQHLNKRATGNINEIISVPVSGHADSLPCVSIHSYKLLVSFFALVVLYMQFNATSGRPNIIYLQYIYGKIVGL